MSVIGDIVNDSDRSKRPPDELSASVKLATYFFLHDDVLNDVHITLASEVPA